MSTNNSSSQNIIILEDMLQDNFILNQSQQMPGQDGKSEPQVMTKERLAFDLISKLYRLKLITKDLQANMTMHKTISRHLSN